MVIVDKEEYNSKAPAYKSLPRDPTNRIKAQPIT